MTVSLSPITARTKRGFRNYVGAVAAPVWVLDENLASVLLSREAPVPNGARSASLAPRMVMMLLHNVCFSVYPWSRNGDAEALTLVSQMIHLRFIKTIKPTIRVTEFNFSRT